MMITFVTHYVDFENRDLTAIKDVIAQVNVNEMYQYPNPKKLIALMFASAHQCHPDAHFVILTDEETELNFGPEIEIHRSPHRNCQLDHERVKSRIRYLEQYTEKNNIIFLDWDILIQKNLNHLFNGDCGLILTYQRDKNWCCNDGVIGISSKEIKKVLEFFQMALKEYSNLENKGYYEWFGFQCILDKIIFPHLENQNLNRLTLNNLKICLISSKAYNASPHSLNYTSDLYPNPAILHFKGYRKRTMSSYWSKHLKPK